MSKNRNIVVFWIDEAPREDFVERLHTAGMEVYFVDNYVDGVQWLDVPANINRCDAVILDVNCKIRRSDESESTDSFRDYAYRVMSRCEEDDRHIPWFVFTSAEGYDESLLNAIPMRDWTRKQYYSKYTDQQQLINDIRELTKHSRNIALRERFASVLDDWQDEATAIRLFDIIKKMDDPNSGTDTTVFNAMRKLLAHAVVYAREHGLFSDDIDSIRAAQRQLEDLHALSPDIVPSYILTNYNSLIDTVNNGSHSKDEDEDGSLNVDMDVLTGKAPYLSRATFYQLITILHWLRQLPTESKEIEALRKRIDLFLTYPMETYEECECYLQCDEEGTWHYGKCAVRERDQYPITERTFVRLYDVQANTYRVTKKRYPFFAKYRTIQDR